MQKIYAIGESLVDIIFDKGEVKAARPGGSMLNSSVSLGRAGKEVYFLSELGNDQIGDLVVGFLETNQVNTRYVHRYTQGKTALALAFLNEKGDAAYDFYKSYPPTRMQLEIPPFSSDDIFLFGSFFGIDPAIRPTMVSIANAAKLAGTLLVYDPNFRKPHAHQLEKLRPFILENMQLAHIIRASHEDMEIIFGETSAKKLSQMPQLKGKVLILTQNSAGVYLQSDFHTACFPAPKIEVVSTIGAGDNFNAGLIFGLVQQNISTKHLPTITHGQWESIIGYAIGFASEVCRSYDNYISEKFAVNLPGNKNNTTPFSQNP